MTAWKRLPDGSTWPRPELASDIALGAEWRARHAPHTVTVGDLMWLASAASAYGSLVVDSTRKRRDYVCREMRQALRAEADQ